MYIGGDLDLLDQYAAVSTKKSIDDTAYMLAWAGEGIYMEQQATASASRGKSGITCDRPTSPTGAYNGL